MAFIDAVEHLRGALDYHLSRHNLLASNLAHIDTPGYKAVDLERANTGKVGEQFSGELKVAMQATQPGHIASSSNVAGTNGNPIGRVVEDPKSANGNDENGVDLDREAVKISTNQVRYDMIAQLASSQLASLAWAASDGKHG